MLEKKVIYFYFMTMTMLLVSVCHVGAVSRCLKRALDGLTLLSYWGLLTRMWVLGTEPESSATAASALNL